MHVIYSNKPAGQAETQPLVLVHLDPSGPTTPLQFVKEVERSLILGAAKHDIERAAAEALCLIMLACQTAMQQGGWGCSNQAMRRALQQASRPAAACAKLAADETTGDAMRAVIAALDGCIQSVAVNS